MKIKRKRKQKTPQQQRRRANRRQRILHIAGRVAFLAVLLAAAVLALTVFFKVETIEVEGSSRYAAADIADSMDVQVGDNLYLWNKVKEADKLLERFPYLDTVQIRRRLPDALVVTVTECQAVLAVPSDSGYYRVSSKGKVLEITPEDGGLPVATGVPLMGTQPGQMIDPAVDAYADALLTVLTALDASGLLPEVDFVNLQSLTDIRIGYQGRFDLRVGTLEQMAYRLRFAMTVIGERLSPSDIGRLYWDARDRLHFVPDTAENVAKSKTTLDTTPAADLNGGETQDGAAEPNGEPQDSADSEDGAAGGGAQDRIDDANGNDSSANNGTEDDGEDDADAA